MYLCISTVVDFNSQNFDPPLMKFDKYSPGVSTQCREIIEIYIYV